MVHQIQHGTDSEGYQLPAHANITVMIHTTELQSAAATPMNVISVILNVMVLGILMSNSRSTGQAGTGTGRDHVTLNSAHVPAG
jgi:hypothetical protein